MDYNYLFNQQKNKLFLERYSLPFVVLIIVFLSYLFYFDNNTGNYFTFLGVAILNSVTLLFIRFYVSPFLHGKSFILFVLVVLFYVLLSLGVYYFLFKFNLFQCPSVISYYPIPEKYKLAFCLLTSITLFYVARSNFLMAHVYQVNIDNFNSIVKANLTEINLLRQQMNPHFLFNALNNINALIRKGDTQLAMQYNAEISSLLNNHLMHIESNTIRLEEEIDWLENYLHIEQKRLPEVFDYKLEIEDEDIYMQNIPPMLLQPLVENSIIHGFSVYPNDKKGMISIKIKEVQKNTITITIKDNGAGVNAIKEAGRARKSISIDNIEKRIQLINEIGLFTIQLNKIIDKSGAQYEMIIKERR
jgi:sensor histidine kinase YesM